VDGSVPVHPVLVVDDEPAIQRALDRMLRLHGFSAVVATTIRDAVSRAETSPLTAVILDLGLKGTESGLDFLAWLRQHPAHGQTPVLILTGQARIAEDEEVLIRRHRAYVFYKPTPFAELAEYLKRLTDPARCA
jgi:two-component system KDP operon response regulator KdpE